MTLYEFLIRHPKGKGKRQTFTKQYAPDIFKAIQQLTESENCTTEDIVYINVIRKIQ